MALRLRLCVLLAGWCAVLGCAGVRAQSSQSSAERAAYMAGLRLDRHMLAGTLAPSPRSAMRLEGSGDSAPQETRELNLLGRGGVVLEVPRAAPDGTFQRPRVLIGRHSPELNAWMKAAGLAPDRCLLPVFRGRMNRNVETGRTGLAVLVSARCTFF